MVVFVLLNCLTCRTIVHKWTAIIIFDKNINITEFFFKGDVKICRIDGGQCFMREGVAQTDLKIQGGLGLMGGLENPRTYEPMYNRIWYDVMDYHSFKMSHCRCSTPPPLSCPN